MVEDFPIPHGIEELEAQHPGITEILRMIVREKPYEGEGVILADAIKTIGDAGVDALLSSGIVEKMQDEDEVILIRRAVRGYILNITGALADAVGKIIGKGTYVNVKAFIRPEKPYYVEQCQDGTKILRFMEYFGEATGYVLGVKDGRYTVRQKP